MKTPTKFSVKNISLAAGLALALNRFDAGAAIAYYDPTGTTGNAQTSGPWEGNVWSATAAGQASPTAWVEGTAAGFSAGIGTAGSTYVVTANVNHTVAGFFNGGIGSPQHLGNLTIAGPGILTLPTGGAQGIYTTNGGNTTVLATIAGSAPLAPQGGGSLFLYGTNTYTGGTLLAGTAGVNFNNSNSFGTGAITWDLGGVVLASVLNDGPSGNTGTTGPLTITNAMKTTNGTLIFANDAGFPVTFSGPVTLQTGTSTFYINDVYQPTNTVTFSGVISSGSAVFVKAGAGVLQLAGANTYTNNTIITNGILQLGANGGLPSGSGRGNVFIANLGGTTNSTLDVNGFSGTVNGLSGNGSLDNSSAAQGTLTVGGNNASSTFTGPITSTGGGQFNIAKTGTGTFTLNSSGLGYTGNTTVSAGTFIVANGVTLPFATPVTVAAGATLNLSNNTGEAFGALSGSGLVTNNGGTISLAGSTNGTNFPSYSCFLGTIDQGSLSKTGTGVMSIRNTNLNNLSFTYSGGVLSVGARPDVLPTNFALSLNSGMLFQLDANAQAVASLNGSGGAINLGGGTLNVTGASASLYSGTIQNSELAGSSTASGHGLRGYYYDGIDFETLDTVRDDATVNLTNMTALPSPPFPKTNNVSVRWLGQVLTTVAGTYTFTGTSDDGQRLWVNGTNLVDDWQSQGATAKSGSISLAANTRYDIVYEYMNIGVGGSAKLAWTPPGDSVSTVIPTDYLFLPGPGNLVISGSGVSTVSLGASNSYTGGTTVVPGGALEASVDNAFGTGNVVINGGSLELDGGSGTNGFINTGADLVLSASPTLALLYTGTDTIRGFSTNGGATYLAAGTYGGPSSPATHKITSIQGNGVLNVSAVPASVILTSSGGSSVYGSSVTFTSTVTGSTPTGTVTFYDGASAIGMATLSGGQATLTVSDLLAATSPHSITAVYSGDAHNVQATSSALIQTVNPLTVSPATLSVSNKLYDATTAASLAPASSTLTGVLPGDTNNVRIGAGTAVFADKNIGTNKSVTVSGLTLSGSLSGNYSLVPNSGASTANITNIGIAVTNVTVTARPYNTTTTAILNTVGAGLSNVLGSDTVTLNSGSASGTFANAAPGVNKAVTVTGFTISGGDATNYTLSQPTNVTGTITQANTTTVLVSSANPSSPGSNVTFTATVTANAPGAGTPTGNVAFITNGTLFTSISLASGSATTPNTSGLSNGPNAILAAYGGDVNFVGSTNSSVTQIVGNSSPGLLTITRVGGNVILNWSNSFTLQESTVVNGTNSGFTDVAGPVTTGPYTNTNTAPKLFFRLRD